MKEDLKIDLATINGNISHTCGNITAIVFEHFKKQFSKGFFKHEHINTRLAIRQYQDIRKTVDFKRQKPILAMQPRLLVDVAEFNINFWHRLYGTSIYDLVRKSYTDVKFFKDPEKNIIMDFAVERSRMTFEYTIIVSTEYAQYNTMAHLRSMLNFEHPFRLYDVTLETVIPECIIDKISRDANIPIIHETLGVKPFIDYLNKWSNIPVTYGKDTATGNNRFFMVINTNLTMNYTGLSISDGNMDGQTSDSFPIQCQLELEFNHPSTFYYLRVLDTEDGKIENINSDDNITITGCIPLHFSDGKIIPDYDDYGNGLYLTCVIDVEKDVDEDRIPIDSILTETHKKIIKKMIVEDKNPSEFMHFTLYKNSDLLVEDNDYYMDWMKLELVIPNPEINKSYRIACYENNSIGNEYVLKNHKY